METSSDPEKQISPIDSVASGTQPFWLDPAYLNERDDTTLGEPD
jgi:hypothetical protein